MPAVLEAWILDVYKRQAALCVQKRGGIPAIPTKEEVEQMLAEKVC